MRPPMPDDMRPGRIPEPMLDPIEEPMLEPIPDPIEEPMLP